MKFWNLVKIANRNLLRNRLRTLLTVLAIFVGALTLVLTNAISDGMREYIDKQVKNIEGGNVLFVRKKFEAADENKNSDEPEEYKEETQDEAGVKFDPNSMEITKSQIDAAAATLPEIKSATPAYLIDGEYITLDGGKKYRLELGMLSEGVVQKTEAGATISAGNQIMIPLALAKAFTQDISTLVNREATIGYKTVAGEMKTLKLTITGVSTKGFIANYNSFVDAETARRIYEEQTAGTERANKFSRYTFLLNAGDDATIEKVKKTLDEKGLTAETLADQRQRTYDGIGMAQIGLNFFAFIVLLAASFGIINTLVIAVIERTKEIGLQKPSGWDAKKIFWLFSIESMLIGFWGAVSGIVAGIVIGTITNLILGWKYANSFEEYKLFSFTAFSIIYVILLISLIAFIAGVLPAYRASRLNPIEALRYE